MLNFFQVNKTEPGENDVIDPGNPVETVLVAKNLEEKVATKTGKE
jgi:hypothetical protein